ncbi:HNH endonuclease [Cohnella kolymensis]|uniref:HNH endonuclease n=1 Tax=Cohnella kolymensis TaxID=1590652 RepID=UPI0006977C43|nr:HNH endonuclease [Cohnella kolymensis]
MKNHYEIRGEVTSIFLKRRNGTDLEMLIDTEDLGKLEALGSKISAQERYATCFVDGKMNYLHRLITNAPQVSLVDHINGNKFDNRKSNLRIVTSHENLQNRKGANRTSKSGIRGVSLDPKTRKFRARVTNQGKHIYLGSFYEIRDAELAVTEYRRTHLPSSEMDRVSV